MNIHTKLSVGIIMMVLLISCAAPKKIIERPRWVDNPPPLGDNLSGVGVAPPMANAAAQRERAAHLARLQMSRTLRTRITGLVRDWVNENSDYFTNAGESLSYFESVSEEITEATLVGSEIKEYYKDADGTLYCLASISKTQAVENMIGKMKQLSSEQTRIIQERAKDAFNELEERAKQIK